MSSETEKKINLLDLDREGLASFFKKIGEKPYRVTQIMKWIYHRSIVDFDQMTDISKKTRDHLKTIATMDMPQVEKEQLSRDGTRKWLLRMDDNAVVEMVFIPTDDRGTLCVSTQVGCKLGCAFCATARLGFQRNLSAAEIISQVWLARACLEKTDNVNVGITNVVLMGMGEPLLNFQNTIAATNLMMDDLAFKLSKRRVTISTSGIVPEIYRLKEHTDVSLAVSLHAPDNQIRNKIMPVNKQYPIEELIPACKNYIAGSTHRAITWEYVLIAGINDSPEHAKKLIKLIKGVPSKINLIPFNSFHGCGMKEPTAKTVDRFAEVIYKSGLTVTVRKSRGDDIDAACGQLAAKND